MTAQEKTDAYNQANQIIIPNKKVVTGEDPFTSTVTTISNGTTTDADHSSTNNRLNSSNELNFVSGMSQFCLKAYLTNEQLQEAREAIRNDMATRKTIKQQLKESTRLSAGIIFKAGCSQLGKTVFDVHMDNLQENNQELIEKIKKEERIYKENVENANKVLEMNLPLELMTIRQLTIVCKPLKRKCDGKMHTKKDSLIQKYKEWSGRPTPSFDISHLVSTQETSDIANNDVEDKSCSNNEERNNNNFVLI